MVMTTRASYVLPSARIPSHVPTTDEGVDGPEGLFAGGESEEDGSLLDALLDPPESQPTRRPTQKRRHTSSGNGDEVMTKKD
jgi:hypothetical protein